MQFWLGWEEKTLGGRRSCVTEREGEMAGKEHGGMSGWEDTMRWERCADERIID